jgi:hypothetical protein
VLSKWNVCIIVVVVYLYVGYSIVCCLIVICFVSFAVCYDLITRFMFYYSFCVCFLNVLFSILCVLYICIVLFIVSLVRNQEGIDASSLGTVDSSV